MKVENNSREIESIAKKLEFRDTKESIGKITESLFSKKAFAIDKSDAKNQIFDVPENTIEDIEQAAANQQSGFVKDAMAALSKTATSEDLTKLNEEGYDFTDTEIETIVTVTDKIQIYLAAHCDDYKPVSDISQEAIEAVAGSSQLAITVANKLKDNNLPVTEDNITDALEALKLSDGISEVSNKAAKYLLENRLPLTIENVYKAEFAVGGISSANAANVGYGAGYYTEGSYYAKGSTEFNWDSLNEQIKNILNNSEIEVNEKTMTDAKWIIENQLPLNKYNMEKLEALNNINFPISKEEAIEKIIASLSQGGRAVDAVLSGGNNYVERAKEAYEVVEGATDKDLKTLIANNSEINIQNLKLAKNSEDYGDSSSDSHNQSANEEDYIDEAAKAVTDEDIRLITARRQLEEIRLKMTVEANLKLLKQGINIETKPIEALISALKDIEDNYYKTLMKNGNVEDTQENLDLFKEITDKVSDIKYLPNNVIGKVVKGDIENTINAIHKSGNELKNQYEAASERYETLMTRPRSDMGDSIKEAFRNIDDILKDMGLELTESNKRAVKILGYNSMELTEENINSIKATDASVNAMIRNMTPQVVLKMIRERNNPLDTDINVLNKQLEEIKAEVADDATEKYSEFLWKLEKNNEITDEERKSFIGMYRLINNVVKTDGEVVGALVNQNADITLKNLLTGVRNIKNKGIDVEVDEGFTGLQKITFKTELINDQISSSFNSDSQEQQSNQNSQAETYYNNLLRQALDEMSPDKLERIFDDGNIKDMSLEQFADKLSSLEEDSKVLDTYFKEQLEMLKTASKAEDSVIKLLEDYSQPVTINNILAANTMLTQRGGMFKKLFDRSSDSRELDEAIEKTIDSFESKDEAINAYSNLEQSVENELDKQLQDPEVKSIDIREIKMLRQEIRLAANISNDERYEVPVRIGDEITSVNLTIVHSDEKSMVNITMDSEKTGKAAAQFTIKNGGVSGFIAVDNVEGLNALKNSKKQFSSLIEEQGLKMDRVDYIEARNVDINSISKGINNKDVNTTDLYRTAKAFIINLKAIG